MTGAAVGIEELARRAGRFAWIESRLFEVLGGWVATVPEPEAKLLLAAHSRHHAWHAEVWRDRLPALPAAAAPPDGGLVAFVDALAEPEAPDRTVEKLVGAYRVLIPAKVAAYTAHLDRASPVADAPTARWLRFVLQDEVDDWRRGEVLLHSLVGTPELVARAAAHQQRLQTLLLAAGGVAGRPDVT